MRTARVGVLAVLVAGTVFAGTAGIASAAPVAPKDGPQSVLLGIPGQIFDAAGSALEPVAADVEAVLGPIETLPGQGQ